MPQYKNMLNYENDLKESKLRGRIDRPEPKRFPRAESQGTHRTESRRNDRMQEDNRPQKYNRPDQHSKGSYARGSNEQPGRCSKDQSEEKSGDKRKFTKIKEPMSPEGMRKAARNVQHACPEVLEWHSADQYPKLFQHIRGERCLHAEELWRI